MNGMQDGRGPLTCSALIKMMKRFEATSSLASRLRCGSPSAAAAVATAVEQTEQSMLEVCAHEECSAREDSRQTRVS